MIFGSMKSLSNGTILSSVENSHSVGINTGGSQSSNNIACFGNGGWDNDFNNGCGDFNNGCGSNRFDRGCGSFNRWGNNC
ncbi:hssA/2C/7E family protein [Heterostelium album PN500]|uniref:HssA/2C/7E family protein n=1 Tax=Heterostelium pallidum (strain ATCC 26659 / Pp 5 / PN500) TaxID=670386 RepID=D3BDW3_HETP5|nr:hssA/2C/7E family protein [Heterostelium album PN500]EFA80094.1 hssA/2C/7E family protein [Heterostelium album PN500]|eukprot:XP_020432214.1 hssA/2C/7E family protein [Heterostelium album PN500]